MITIEDIYRYPIKSLAGEPLDIVQLTKEGIVGDREWGLVSPDQPALDNGAWISSSTFERLTIRPEMATWSATSTATGIQLVVDGKDIHLIEREEAMIGNRKVRLARADNGYWDHADATISIINLATVEAISEAIGVSVDPARFRANIYIRAKPWSEFEWLGCNLQFDDTTLTIIKPIDRCKATSVTPNSGEITYNMPAQLARHFGHIYCGVYARVIKEGSISINNKGYIGDSVTTTNNAKVDNEAIRSAADQVTAPALIHWPRSAQVVKVVDEATDIRSIWLQDALESLGAWKNFIPGQHVRIHGLVDSGTWRTYTVSSYDNNLFRVTVKRDTGIGSGRMHALKEGDKVTITGPEGHLATPHRAKSLHFITAGIGITPAIAMLADLQQYEGSIHFTHTARSEQIALWNEIESFAATRPNVQADLFISNVDSKFESAYKNSYSGRPDLALIARAVYDNEAHVIVCGPTEFSTDTLVALTKENIPAERISSETFTSATIETTMRAAPSSGPYTVSFLESGIEVVWRKEDGTLLDLAERHGLVPSAHCLAGICGTCRVSLSKDSQVAQLAGMTCQEDMVLLCCSVPTSDIKLSI